MKPRILTSKWRAVCLGVAGMTLAAFPAGAQELIVEAQQFLVKPGDVVTVQGTLTNPEATDLLVTSGALFLSTQPYNPDWHFAFAGPLLADDFSLRPGGYAGPLCTLYIPTNAPLAVFGHGWIELTVERPEAPDQRRKVRADLVLNQPTLGIRSGTNTVEITWPASARAFQLESAALGIATPIFVPVTNAVSEAEGARSTVLEVADPNLLFRLSGPEFRP